MHYLCIKKANMKKTLPLALLILTSCAAHRHTIDHTRQKTEIADSLAITGSAQLFHTRFTALTAAADSAAFTIDADSLVTPDGTRVYRPRLSAAAHAPRLTSADTSHTYKTAEAARTQTRARLSDTAVSSEADSAAKATAPSLLNALALLALLAALILYLRYQLRHRDL